jgi:hypothetical protein
MYRLGQDNKLRRCLTTLKAHIVLRELHEGMIVMHPKLLEKLKCESKTKNNIKRRNWGTFLSSQHFGGKRGVFKL